MSYRNFVFAVFLGLSCGVFAGAVDAQSGRLQPVRDSMLIEDLQVESKKTGVDPGKTYAVGRVTDFWGRGLRTSAITLYCLDSNEVVRSYSNAFGYYQFQDLEAGNYLIAIQHRSYVFVMGSMSFTVESDPVEINFQAERLR